MVSEFQKAKNEQINERCRKTNRILYLTFSISFSLSLSLVISQSLNMYMKLDGFIFSNAVAYETDWNETMDFMMVLGKLLKGLSHCSQLPMHFVLC